MFSLLARVERHSADLIPFSPLFDHCLSNNLPNLADEKRQQNLYEFREAWGEEGEGEKISTNQKLGVPLE